MEKNLIKISRKFITILVIVIIGLFLLAIYISKIASSKYTEIDYHSEIESIELKGTENFGALRGALFYEKNKYINTNAILIKNNTLDLSLWESSSPIIDFDNNPHQYTLDDLSFPFVIYKKAKSDTIVAEKEGFTFKFKMINH